MRLTFEAWMMQVDEQLVKLCGLDSRDLVDFCYADEYDSGATPRGAARRALRAQEGD